MHPTPEDLARDLEADLRLCEQATAGPWKLIQDTEDPGNWSVWTASPGWCGFYDLSIMLERDARFIAAAREAWPAAIRRALAAEAECERLRALAEGLAARVAVQAELLERRATR